MSFLDKILGREPEREPAGRRPLGQGAGVGQRTPDERAIERYRYLLSTAPPEAVEQAHAEAFAQLTPDQRRQVLQQLSEHAPPNERQGDDPASLARMATRTEMRRPGTLERTFRGGPGGSGGGPGFGAMVGGSLLGTIAGVVVGSAIANAMFGPAFGDLGSDQFAGGGEGGDAGGDAGADASGDAGGDVAADGGGDYGGGDFGGGDFGGGDFGGGDFGGF